MANQMVGKNCHTPILMKKTPSIMKYVKEKQESIEVLHQLVNRN